MRVMPFRVWGTVQVRGTPDLVAIMAGVDVLQVMLDPRMAGWVQQIDVISSGSSVPSIWGFNSGGTPVILVAALTNAIVRASKAHKRS